MRAIIDAIIIAGLLSALMPTLDHQQDARHAQSHRTTI